MTNNIGKILAVMSVCILCFSCGQRQENSENNKSQKIDMTAKDILGNPAYLAMSYGGYRYVDHDIEPTLDELKEDMKLLSAMGSQFIRTYKVHFPQASNILKAISILKMEDPNFEMYVMLGAWINCKNAWTDQEPDHNQESESNETEIEEVVRLANQYPDIVKVIAVGNEAMVKWATSYYVQPDVILKWVNHLQNLKKQDNLNKDLWITSSDNFASWGGGDSTYHNQTLELLIKAVDYVSLHTYPMHDTHYNPDFWGILKSEKDLADIEKIDKAMERALKYAQKQFQNTVDYIRRVDIQKDIHIGETGWASASNGHYGSVGSKATDEYKQAVYYKLIRNWTNEKEISCFYFEAFDEPWKDGNNPGGSENHFGLFSVDGQAKYALWDLVDQDVFSGLTRGNGAISKSFNGNKEELMKEIKMPPIKQLEVAY
jgi:exo-beta-1,3-glucanase (GH17 family)